MSSGPNCILTLNGGSSSIRFAVYEFAVEPRCVLSGQLDRIGQPRPRLSVRDPATGPQAHQPMAAPDQATAISGLLDWLTAQPTLADVQAVGHRVVHGGPAHQQPERITPVLLADLQQLIPFDPTHLPGALALIEAVHARYPHLPQVACFDTAFHQHMPRVAQLLPLPRRFDARGIRRYGFHGLSYAYLLQELARLAGPAAAQGRVVLAHLGNGASLAAVRGGQCQDTTMGFTPVGGLVMGTRPGDLDPGVVSYLLESEGLSASQFSQLVNHECGLLGVSETSSDMQELLARQATDGRAAEAVDLFCYQVRKGVGAYAAVLGGLDTLVFAGGIGEHAAEVRARICQGLAFLGVEVDEARNAAHAGVISPAGRRVTVRVIPTDEERLIARTVSQLLTAEPA